MGYIYNTIIVQRKPSLSCPFHKEERSLSSTDISGVEQFCRDSTEIKMLALAAVAQWIRCQLANERVAGLIPRQGTCLGCKPGPQ